MYLHQGLSRLIFLGLIVFIPKFQIEGISYAGESAFDRMYTPYGKVLSIYVKDGLVEYKGLKSNPGDLNSFLMQTTVVTRDDFDSWTEDEQLAFLINLYNARTLELIIDNYPVKSIKDIGGNSKGPWNMPVVMLFGENVSLNTLEHRYIRKNYEEPRIHFALVCAARGCPPLLNEPYRAGKLDSQLESQTRKFLSDSKKNSVDVNNKVVRLSPIFLWYAEDFKGKSVSVKEFIKLYFDNMNFDDYTVQYTQYDWSLNDVATNDN